MLGLSDEPNPEGEAWRERLSGLGAAILRVSTGPDISAVPREMVDGARALTAASWPPSARTAAGRRHAQLHCRRGAGRRQPAERVPPGRRDPKPRLPNVRHSLVRRLL